MFNETRTLFTRPSDFSKTNSCIRASYLTHADLLRPQVSFKAAAWSTWWHCLERALLSQVWRTKRSSWKRSAEAQACVKSI